jgi:hypothetical protein
MAHVTPAYRFTVESIDDPRIEALRADASLSNRSRIEADPDVKYLHRVVVRGRLGTNNPHAHLYRPGGPLHRYSSQTIRPEHASRFDVYLNTYRRRRQTCEPVPLHPEEHSVEELRDSVRDLLNGLREDVVRAGEGMGFYPERALAVLHEEMAFSLPLDE